MKEFSGDKEYEERADFIEREDLERWTVDSDFFKKIQKSLLQQGAKLIVGPRGTGKTHQMRMAYLKCLCDKRLPLSIYTSFSKYYHLEPFLFKAPNAIHIFHTWILCKILSSCHELIDALEEESLKEIIPYDRAKLDKFIAQTEKGITTVDHDEFIENVTIRLTTEIIEELASETDRKRTVLLLDDAALTLTPDYLVEFFDVFRNLKTKIVSPKASVYPGTTQYGPRFHLGQDAQEVNAWAFDGDDSYRRFTESLLEKRLSEPARKMPRDIVELLRYSSFGIPRAFINLIRNYMLTDGRTFQQRFNKVIEDQARVLRAEYLSLSCKMPQYRSIIQAGYIFFENVTSILAKENRKDKKNRGGDQTKQMEIGILQESSNVQLDRMVRFLTEAGLIYERPQVSHGPDRIYKRYVPHILFLMKNRAFSSGRGFYDKNTIQMLGRKDEKHPVRRTFDKLLPMKREALKLDLPPCSNCGTERLTEEQKFCHQCGRELIGQSAYERCIQIPIDELPMPEWQKTRITEYTDFKCIGDIVTAQSPASELQKAPYIGPKRSGKIYEMARKLVEEFLA